MNPDGSIDTSGVTFAGDDKGRIELKVGDAMPVLLFTADQLGVREYRLGKIVAAVGVKEAVKLSGIVRFRLIVEEIDGRLADEDSIDINHCQQIEIQVDRLYAAKRYCGTIKGASRDISITVGQQIGHGAETDWDYGNFSDQGNAKTAACSLAVGLAQPPPVAVRVLTADKPALSGSPFKVDTKLSGGWFYPVFNFIKDLLRFFGKKI